MKSGRGRWIYFPASEFIDNGPKRERCNDPYICVLLWLSSIVQLAGHWMPYARARPVISGPSTHDNILNPAPTAFPRGPEGGPCTSPLVLALRKWEPLPILCLLNVFNRVIAADITNWTMKEMAAHRDFERGDRRIFSSRDWGCCLPNICSYYIYSIGTFESRKKLWKIKINKK